MVEVRWRSLAPEEPGKHEPGQGEPGGQRGGHVQLTEALGERDAEQLRSRRDSGLVQVKVYDACDSREQP